MNMNWDCESAEVNREDVVQKTLRKLSFSYFLVVINLFPDNLYYPET